jgi:hypothetical protein
MRFCPHPIARGRWAFALQRIEAAIVVAAGPLTADLDAAFGFVTLWAGKRRISLMSPAV